MNGDGASDSLVLQLESPESDFLVLEVNGNRDLRFDRTTFTAVVVDAGAGEDRVAVSRANGPFLDERLSLDGGAGDDVVAGGDGIDLLFGGSGDDTLDGNASADIVSLGTGDDVFTWNLLDGSDTVRGDDGRGRAGVQRYGCAGAVHRDRRRLARAATARSGATSP